jgi:hypothetical protein
VLATAAWAAGKRWAEPGERKPCILRTRRRIGTCEPSVRWFLRLPRACRRPRPHCRPPARDISAGHRSSPTSPPGVTGCSGDLADAALAWRSSARNERPRSGPSRRRRRCCARPAVPRRRPQANANLTRRRSWPGSFPAASAAPSGSFPSPLAGRPPGSWTGRPLPAAR